MNITAVIVNYHTASLLPPLINDLLEDSLVSQIIVVDNSKELSESVPLAISPDLKTIINQDNMGFGAAVNQALKFAKGDWILVVNPDVRFEEGCIGHLLYAARHYATPLVGPRFYWDDQRSFRLPPATGNCLWLDFASMSAGKYELDAELFSFYWTLRHERFWEVKEPFFEPFLSGACLLVEKEWIASLGGKLFDERFFLYFEDTDLCVRAIRDNVRPLCVPQARAIHYYDQSPAPDDSKAQYMAKAHSQYIVKHYGKLPSFPLDPPLYSPSVIDLGEKINPPTFEIEKQETEEDRFFEVGVTPYFVPFTQADVKGDVFEFPSDIWARCSSGIYYGRLRYPVSGIKKVWKWNKQ